MFQQMLNASRAILLGPSVATFEEYERDDLGAALIYTTVAAVIAAILSAVGTLIRSTALEQLGGIEQQLSDSPLLPLLRSLLGGGSLVFTLFFTLILTILGFLIFVAIIYLLGRAFGGTGTYGVMAFNAALYSAPLTVISALIGLIPFVGFLASIVLAIYQLYLYWLSIQAGMNLPANKALWVVLIPLIVLLLLCCGLFALIVSLILIVSNQTSP